MKWFASLLLATFSLTAAFGQSADLFTDAIRSASYSSGSLFVTPFTFGVVDAQNQVLLGASYATPLVTTTSTTYSTNPDIFFTAMATSYTLVAGAPTYYASQISWNFSAKDFTQNGRTIPAGSVAMYSQDHIPAVETILQKGSYTFTSAATPIGGKTTPGTFQFQTLTAGVWTTQFSLALTKAVTDKRTVSLTTTTRARWLLIRSGSAVAQAAVTIRYQTN